MPSLEMQIQSILDDFDHASSDEIIGVLNQIKPHFKNVSISEYLQRKIQKINDVTDPLEKKTQCKALMPYLDWYLQGLNN